MVTDWPDRPAVLSTAIGTLIVGTPEHDSYTNRAVLVLDPAGDDTYAGCAGVADGRARPALAAVVDLAGNDRYLGSGPLAPGSALFGAAVLVDGSGDDLHSAPQGLKFWECYDLRTRKPFEEHRELYVSARHELGALGIKFRF